MSDGEGDSPHLSEADLAFPRTAGHQAGEPVCQSALCCGTKPWVVNLGRLVWVVDTALQDGTVPLVWAQTKALHGNGETHVTEKGCNPRSRDPFLGHPQRPCSCGPQHLPTHNSSHVSAHELEMSPNSDQPLFCCVKNALSADMAKLTEKIAR